MVDSGFRAIVFPRMQGYTFKEIDTRHGRVKGTAFRAFKRVRSALHEGADFQVLDAASDSERIEALRREGRIYATSVNVVILSEAGYRQVRAALAGGDGPSR